MTPSIRDRWLLPRDAAFLNHGSFGACPIPVLEEQARWRQEMERQPVQFLDRRLAELLAEARARVGTFLRADPEGLAFVPNATAAVGTVLRSIALEPDDEVVLTDHAYPAVLNAARTICAAAGARAVVAPVPLPLPDDDEIVARIADAVGLRCRLVLVDHVTSSTAAILPVARVVEACRARGVPVLVDAAHAPGMLDVDVDALAADYWTGNFHKWVCAPKGAAALCVRDEPARARLAPPIVSHEYLRTFHERFDWVGTYDPTAWLTIPAALDFFDELGWDEVRAHNRALALEAREIVRASIDAPVLVRDDATGWMSIVPLPEGVVRDRDEARAFSARAWDEHRIEVPVAGWRDRAFLRLSAHVYNARADYERLAAVLPDIVRHGAS